MVPLPHAVNPVSSTVVLLAYLLTDDFFSLSHTLTHSHTLIITCISGQGVMNSVVHAIASTGELYSLMQYLEEKFHWGTIRENFHCNIVQNATDGK